MSRTGAQLLTGFSRFIGDEWLAYAAGFFDGEGSVVIQKVRPSGASVSPRYSLQVQIGNTYRPILAIFLERFGGAVYERKSQNRYGKRMQWQWQARNDTAAAFLEAVRPYLIEKADRAWLGLEFFNQKTKPAAMKLGLTESELALREGYRLAMRTLTHRGAA